MLQSRFEEKVIPEPNSGCWLWMAATVRGYGVIGRGRRGSGNVLAHRLSWEIYRGELTDEQCVLHKCDNPACVNPAHLFLGSRKDNCDDMWRKGRGRPPKWNGRSGHPQAKLTDGQVVEIRRRRLDGERLVDLAKEFKICVDTIANIAARKRSYA